MSATSNAINFTGRLKFYKGDYAEIMVCSKPCFHAPGWEQRAKSKRKRKELSVENSVENTSRAVRRARAQLRDIALANDFQYFVTLTLDKTKIDRYDVSVITRKLNAWLSNQVQRRGLRYILVPERHQDGAIHFHGFFNDALPAVDSGTLIPPGGGRPRKPRSQKQRDDWLAHGGRIVYNLPSWSYGFTSAMELYGDYEAAVGYCSKYIGKDMEPDSPDGSAGTADPAAAAPGSKIGGRWYYSGGDLDRPRVQLVNLDYREVAAQRGAFEIQVPEAGCSFVVLRGHGIAEQKVEHLFDAALSHIGREIGS